MKRPEGHHSSPFSLVISLSSLVLLLLPQSHLTLASPLATTTPSSPSSLFSRADECPDYTYTQCGPTLPANFCCGPQTSCLVLAGDTTVICCPVGKDCGGITPITCAINAMNVASQPKAQAFTTALDSKLPQCGEGCCPFGYSCGQSEGKPVCLMEEDQSVKPGGGQNAATTQVKTQTETAGNTAVETLTRTSFTKGTYPTTLTPDEDDGSGGGEEKEADEEDDSARNKRAAVVAGTTIAAFCFVGALIFYLWIVWRRKKQVQEKEIARMTLPRTLVLSSSGGEGPSSPPPGILIHPTTMSSFGKPGRSETSLRSPNGTPKIGVGRGVFKSLTTKPSTTSFVRPHSRVSEDTEAKEEKWGIRMQFQGFGLPRLPSLNRHGGRGRRDDGDGGSTVAATGSASNSDGSQTPIREARDPARIRSLNFLNEKWRKATAAATRRKPSRPAIITAFFPPSTSRHSTPNIDTPPTQPPPTQSSTSILPAELHSPQPNEQIEPFELPSPVPDRAPQELMSPLSPLSPLSPAVEEISRPARVFRKDAERRDRRIRVLNLLGTSRLGTAGTAGTAGSVRVGRAASGRSGRVRRAGSGAAAVELPASPVSLRFLGSGTSDASGSGGGSGGSSQDAVVDEREGGESRQEDVVRKGKERLRVSVIPSINTSGHKSPIATSRFGVGSLGRGTAARASLLRKEVQAPAASRAKRYGEGSDGKKDGETGEEDVPKKTPTPPPYLSPNFAGPARMPIVPPLRSATAPASSLPLSSHPNEKEVVPTASADALPVSRFSPWNSPPSFCSTDSFAPHDRVCREISPSSPVSKPLGASTPKLTSPTSISGSRFNSIYGAGPSFTSGSEHNHANMTARLSKSFSAVEDVIISLDSYGAGVSTFSTFPTTFPASSSFHTNKTTTTNAAEHTAADNAAGDGTVSTNTTTTFTTVATATTAPSDHGEGGDDLPTNPNTPRPSPKIPQKPSSFSAISRYSRPESSRFSRSSSHRPTSSTMRKALASPAPSLMLSPDVTSRPSLGLGLLWGGGGRGDRVSRSGGDLRDKNVDRDGNTGSRGVDEVKTKPTTHGGCTCGKGKASRRPAVVSTRRDDSEAHGTDDMAPKSHRVHEWEEHNETGTEGEKDQEIARERETETMTPTQRAVAIPVPTSAVSPSPSPFPLIAYGYGHHRHHHYQLRQQTPRQKQVRGVKSEPGLRGLYQGDHDSGEDGHDHGNCEGDEE